MEKNKKEFEVFLEVAGALNKVFGVAPALFGSLGLYRIIGEQGKVNDVDILVPDEFIKERWADLISLMQSLGFELKNEKEHEFFREAIVAFGDQKDLKTRVGIHPQELKVNIIGEVKFKELSATQYLAVYQFMSRDQYRKEKKGLADQAKIVSLREYLEKSPKDFYQVSLKIFLKNKKGQVLILKAADDGIYKGFYDLPGGRINLDEFEAPFEKIIRREIKEEIGDLDFDLSLRPVALGRSFNSRNESPLGGPVHLLNIFFEAQYKSGEIKISDEHLGFRWEKLREQNLEKIFTSPILQGAKMYFDHPKKLSSLAS